MSGSEDGKIKIWNWEFTLISEIDVSALVYNNNTPVFPRALSCQDGKALLVLSFIYRFLSFFSSSSYFYLVDLYMSINEISSDNFSVLNGELFYFDLLQGTAKNSIIEINIESKQATLLMEVFFFFVFKTLSIALNINEAVNK